MKPLNYAILKYVTSVDEASPDDVMRVLEPVYGSFKAFKKNEILNALLTAEANGLLEETRCDLDDAGNVRLYFHAPQEGAATINNYIRD